MAKEAATNHNSHPTTILLMLLAACFVVATCRGETDAEKLLKFRNSLTTSNGGDSALKDWEESPTPCTNDTQNWTGVRCSRGIVIGLRLENMNLMGMIDVDTLSRLPGLRSLSFINNSFDGPMPSVGKLTLRALYLSLNKFTGEIPSDAFAGMDQLKKVHLARNHFSGQIPKSLAGLQKLLQLNLEGNSFQAKIPDFPLAHLTMLDLSYNQLVGRIPDTLSNFDATSFQGTLIDFSNSSSFINTYQLAATSNR